MNWTEKWSFGRLIKLGNDLLDDELNKKMIYWNLKD